MGYRSNPILLRLGKRVTWSSNSFIKYDYSLEYLKHLQVYKYLNQLFRNNLFPARVLFFSHINVLRSNNVYTINIHLLDKRLYLTKTFKFFWRISKGKLGELKKSWNLLRWRPWKKRLRFKTNVYIKRKKIAKLFFIFSRYVLPFLKYTVHPQYSFCSLILTQFINKLVSKHGLLNILDKLTRYESTYLLNSRIYRKILLSFKNYILNILKILKLLSILIKFSNVSNRIDSINKDAFRLKRLFAILQPKIPYRNYKKLRYLRLKYQLSKPFTRAEVLQGSPSASFIYKIKRSKTRHVKKLGIAFILKSRNRDMLNRNFRRILTRYLKFYYKKTTITKKKDSKKKYKIFKRGLNKLRTRSKAQFKHNILPTIRYKSNFAKLFRRRKRTLLQHLILLRRRKQRVFFRRRRWNFRKIHLRKYKSRKKWQVGRKKRFKILKKLPKYKSRFKRFTRIRRTLRRKAKFKKFRPIIYLFRKNTRISRKFRKFKKTRRTYRKQLKRVSARNHFILRNILPYNVNTNIGNYRFLQGYIKGHYYKKFKKVLQRHKHKRFEAIKFKYKLALKNAGIWSKLVISQRLKKYKRKLLKRGKTNLHPIKYSGFLFRNILVRIKRQNKLRKYLLKKNRKYLRIDRLNYLSTWRFRKYISKSNHFNKNPLQPIYSKKANSLILNKAPLIIKTSVSSLLNCKVSLLKDLLSYTKYKIYKNTAALCIMLLKVIRPVINVRLFLDNLFIFLKKLWYYQLFINIKTDIIKLLGQWVIINFLKVRKGCYHPNLITKFIVFRLLKQYRFGEVVFPMLKELNRNRKKSGIKGILIICSGRLTRKQRASRRGLVINKIGLNTLSSKILYSFDTVRLRYGMSGLKLYVSYGNNI